jgi:imidazoleglycerol-phosphate dehydratase
VFLGHYTPVAVGDYLAGPNHVLPAGGTARFFSPLGVDDFLKRTAFVRFEPPKLRELGSRGIHGSRRLGRAPAGEDPPRAPRARGGARGRVGGRMGALMDQPKRSASIERKTRETEVRVDFTIDGSGEYDVETGVPFFGHMLESFAKHGLFDLRLRAKGDLAVDLHHTVEDVGIVLGQAIRKALGDAKGIRRYGSQVLPMAESKAEVAVDVSNRAFLVYRVSLANDRVGSFDVSLVEDFLYALAQNAGLDLHVTLHYGQSPHHAVEAIFKGVARALREALELDPRQTGLPTVKGAL